MILTDLMKEAATFESMEGAYGHFKTREGVPQETRDVFKTLYNPTGKLMDREAFAKFYEDSRRHYASTIGC